MNAGFGPNTGIYSVGRTRHPIVYSALGSHASYCAPDRYDICDVDPRSPWDDVTAFGGATWKTWNSGLENARESGWYGYGGRWGPIAALDLGDPLREMSSGPGRARVLAETIAESVVRIRLLLGRVICRPTSVGRATPTTRERSPRSGCDGGSGMRSTSRRSSASARWRGVYATSQLAAFLSRGGRAPHRDGRPGRLQMVASVRHSPRLW